MSRLRRWVSALDAFFSPVASSTRGEVNRHEWTRIVKVSFMSAVINFFIMIASEFRDRPEIVSQNAIVSACVTGISACVLSYLHRKQDSASSSSGP